MVNAMVPLMIERYSSTVYTFSNIGARKIVVKMLTLDAADWSLIPPPPLGMITENRARKAKLSVTSK